MSLAKKAEKKTKVKKNLCSRCPHLCCRYFAFPIEAPEDWDDYDDIRWYLAHKNISVFVEVRRTLKPADLVVPSLDTGSNQIFQYVNRPHHDITFSKMLEGLVKFRDEYDGKYWLEVFLLAGVTTPEMEINRLKTCINSICPDKIQVNTVTRPPAENFAEPVPQKQLNDLAAQLYENAEVVADYKSVHKQQDFSVRREDVLTLLKRRPCSIEDIAAGLGLHRNEVVKYIEELSSEGKIESKPHNQQLYYKAVT